MADNKLIEMNKNIANLIKARGEYLDSKMPIIAKFKIGEIIYDLDKGVALGTVRSYYRYWKDRNPLLDDLICIEYEYETSHRCFSNTSSSPGIRFGNYDDLIKDKTSELEFLKSMGKE